MYVLEYAHDAQSDLPNAHRSPADQRLFCDLVGSTAFSSGMDEEDVFQVFSEYQRDVARVVARFGGPVAQCMGDGVMAYFGYPEAHENDTERAVRVGLALVGAAGRVAAPAQGLSPPSGSRASRSPYFGSCALPWALPASGLAHGRAVDAWNLLRPVCDCYHEGVDLPDLRAARAMLEIAQA